MLSRLLTAACVVGFMSFVPMLADAQKVASYDFTDTKPLERLRPPLPPQPLKHPTTRDPSHPPPLPKEEEIGRGVCGGILANPPIVVFILSLDHDSYTFGDEFHFVLQVKAVAPTRVPVLTSLAKIEPADPSQSYKWRPMWINMLLRDANNREAGMGLLKLYGSPDSPGSEIELKAGEWVEMLGKARMQWRNPPKGIPVPRSAIPIPLSEAQHFTVTAVEQRQGSLRYDAATKRETQLCDYPAEWSGSGVSMGLTVRPKPPS
jgi:hypothetical protein